MNPVSSPPSDHLDEGNEDALVRELGLDDRVSVRFAAIDEVSGLTS